MPKPHRTQPFDVVVAVRLLRPAATLAELADDLAVSPSQVHAAVKRLEVAGLLKAEQRATNPRALLELVLGGLRYLFPAQRLALNSGIPTAHSAAPLNAVVDAIDVVVWPAPKLSGSVRGFGLTPLYPRAVMLPERDPETYSLLCLVDALRLGDPKLRSHARDAVESRLSR
jgi:DNA-binding Lrp family transcriptional regulator